MLSVAQDIDINRSEVSLVSISVIVEKIKDDGKNKFMT